jgi:hypothetical protein
MVRRIKQIVEQAKREGEWVDDVILKYRDEFVAQVNAFVANPKTFLPYQVPKPLDEPEEVAPLSPEELEAYWDAVAEEIGKETAAGRRRLEEKSQAWRAWLETEEVLSDAQCDGRTDAI